MPMMVLTTQKASAPNVPTGLAANATSTTTIDVTWNAATNVSGSQLSGYRLYRDGALIASPATNSYGDSGLSAGTAYSYTVASAAGNHLSSRSAAVVESTDVVEGSTELLEADWQARANGPGVIWLHDFRSVNEVNAFRWDFGTGNDPNDQSVPNRCRHRSDDGITGGCLEQFRAAGTTEPPEWWRPFSPLTAPGNGLSANDPAANGTLTVQSYSPTQGGSQIQSWGHRGYYGHADYHSAFPGAFNGTDYWIQCRIKISANRVSQPEGGKLFYFTRTDMSGTDQEIVTVSNNVVTALNPSANLLKLYRSLSPPLEDDDPGTARQPGNTMGVCQTSPTLDGSGCFYTPQDEWFTFLYHITPGHDSGGDTRVELWVARAGETEYTKIWDQSNVDLPFGPGFPFGHNALICAGWMNSLTFTQDVYHRFCQLLFSHNWIPAPKVHDTTSNALIAEAASLSAGQSTTDIGGTNGSVGLSADALGSIQWVNRFFYDHERKQAIVLGKYASAQSSPQGGRTISLFNAATNSWTDSGTFMIGSTEIGHVYESFAYDPRARQVYSARYGTTAQPIQIHTIGDPLTTWTNTATPPWALNSNGQQAVICWHPNLFDYDDGGLIAIRLVSGTTMQLVTWRKATNMWTANLVQSTAPTQHGAMCYVRYYDAVFATHANGNTYRIGAGRNGTAATPVLITSPPIACRHAGGGDNYGILIDDPTGRAGPYILEKGGSNRVWKYNVTTGAWDLKAYTHPFPAGSPSSDTDWCAAECYPLGVFACRRDVTTAGSVLQWRPND